VLGAIGIFVGRIAPRLVYMSRNKAVATFFIISLIFFLLYCVTSPPEVQTLVTAAPVDPTSTPQGQIEEIADNAAPGMTNDTKEYHLRNVVVVPDTGGSGGPGSLNRISASLSGLLPVRAAARVS
jgi:hypothetical protein